MILNRLAGLGRRKVAAGLRHRSVSAPTENADPTRERADARCLTAPDLCSWPPTSHPQPPSPRYTKHLQPTAPRAHAYYDSTCFDRVPEQSGLPLSCGTVTHSAMMRRRGRGCSRQAGRRPAATAAYSAAPFPRQIKAVADATGRDPRWRARAHSGSGQRCRQQWLHRDHP